MPVVTTSFEDAFQSVNSAIASASAFVYDHSMGWVMMFILLGGGIYLTIRGRGLQFRLFGHMISTVLGSRKGAGDDGISSFQAFALGLADRVGTGNIAGVAIALVLGGPGAIFWMWIVASIGMATAFLEATLAQVFKVRNPDGTFRGGPAYYMAHGLGWTKFAKVFAVCLIFTKGCAFEMVQANTVATTVKAVYGVPTWTTALLLLLISAPFIMTGVKPVARLAEFLAPVMAIAYLTLGVAMLVINYDAIPTVFGWIFSYAFGIESITGGVAGGIVIAMLQGTRRGLYSNEAGMGTVPNAAATATVNHPVRQGLIQSLGVFADTMVVCTCTALIIMVSGLYDPTRQMDSVDGAALTLQAVGTLGEWTTPIMVVIITIFSYSTLLGNFAYAEGNVKFLRGISSNCTGLKLLILVSMTLGAVLDLKAVWSIADWMSAICACLNIVAVIALSKWAIGALRDYQAQRKSGIDPDEIVFCTTENPFLPDDLIGSMWTEDAWTRKLNRGVHHPRKPGDFLGWLMREDL
ncbi:MAG: alanine/glycine:cation symporter family protein [Actinomycetaceae bacterium]|nr:alanine/glycine:cation symporter family protein [Actinomycetaceae bacterium]